MTKANKLTIVSSNKGYRVTKDGILLGLDGTPRSLNSDSKGYLNCTIRFEGGCTRLYVHKLQAYQKYGYDLFKQGVVVRHKDGIPSNNTWDNILIGTQSDNMMDIPKEQRILNAVTHRKYDHEAILKDRALGLNYEELMEKYNISSKGSLSYVINKSLRSKNIAM